MYVSQLDEMERISLMRSAHDALACLGFDGKCLEYELKIVAESKVRDLNCLIDVKPYV